MKKGIYTAILIITFLSIGACSSKMGAVNVAHEEFRPRGPYFWVQPSGVYKGAIPCSDCPGIEVTLNFKTNNTVEKSMRYIKGGRRVVNYKGSWVVQPGNIVQVSFPNNNITEYYKAKAGAHLVALNANKEEDKSPNGQFNVFSKD